jgi:hypothetical protein
VCRDEPAPIDNLNVLEYDAFADFATRNYDSPEASASLRRMRALPRRRERLRSASSRRTARRRGRE